jgi:ATP-binding cassette subfamily B multidrug efflux pump
MRAPAPSAVQDRQDAGVLQVTHGEVCFHTVPFGYGNGAKVIEHMDLRVRPGERVELVGLSGADRSVRDNRQSGGSLADSAIEKFSEQGP